MGKGKPRGLNSARKLRVHRRNNRWADQAYKARLLGTAFKSLHLVVHLTPKVSFWKNWY